MDKKTQSFGEDEKILEFVTIDRKNNATVDLERTCSELMHTQTL